MRPLFYLCAHFVDRRNIASTSARQADITLTVDGKEVTVPQGSYFFYLSVILSVEFPQVPLSYRPVRLLDHRYPGALTARLFYSQLSSCPLDFAIMTGKYISLTNADTNPFFDRKTGHSRELSVRPILLRLLCPPLTGYSMCLVEVARSPKPVASW
jgi:hypothetical protein